jgi:hypothetical protein
MALNQIPGSGVNSSTQSAPKQVADTVSKSKNGRQQGEGEKQNPYSDQVSISGKAARLESLSKELFSPNAVETQLGEVAHKLYEYGFISIEDLNHIPLETRSQGVFNASQAVDVLQNQAQELALQGEDNQTLEGMNKVLVTLKNITAPSYPTSAYQRVTGYGYVGIQ